MTHLMKLSFVFDGVCACGKACSNADLHSINKNYKYATKLCTECFTQYCYELQSSQYNNNNYNKPIDIIPISAKSHYESHYNGGIEWNMPPVLKKGDMVRICCDDIDDFGELFWCIIVSDINKDGSMFVKINNKLHGNYNQQFGDIIPVPIYPEHIFDYIFRYM